MPASADFIGPLKMMELYCRALSSLKALKTAQENQLGLILLDFWLNIPSVHMTKVNDGSDIKIVISMIPVIVSYVIFMVFSWFSKKLKSRCFETICWSRDDFVESDCIIIIIEEGIIECICPQEPFVLKLAQLFPALKILYPEWKNRLRNRLQQIVSKHVDF